jgi:hypothetical protein
METYPRKRRAWPFIVGALVLAFCVVGGIAALGGTNPGRSVSTATGPGEIVGEAGGKAAASAAPNAKPKAPAGPRKTIAGDDLVHVGEDVAPGVYRVVEPIDGGQCYWKKSSDAEGDNIIDNDIPAGGRPQVTLKKGQWFTSKRCPEWAAK